MFLYDTWMTGYTHSLHVFNLRFFHVSSMGDFNIAEYLPQPATETFTEKACEACKPKIRMGRPILYY